MQPVPGRKIIGREPKVARPRNLGLNDAIPLGLGNGFGHDGENGNRGGHAPRQSPSRAANRDLGLKQLKVFYPLFD
jgi:hypothetical protein